MERNLLEIKGIEDRLNVARILVANGYTVRVVPIKSGNGQKATTYIELWREK
jgi:hypothetical protein